jgi:hypothetical protein
MAAEDVLERPLDAAGKRIRRLGDPVTAKDATFTDTSTVPKAGSGAGSPGSSLLAAPADHVHPATSGTTLAMRVAAHATTTLAPGARVTLATFPRSLHEVFIASGFAYVIDDVAGVTWESRVDGATHIATYHERTVNHDELAFRAVNVGTQTRTLEWATVALNHAP